MGRPFLCPADCPLLIVAIPNHSSPRSNHGAIDYFGNRNVSFGRAALFALKSRDALDAGIGNLMDADLAKESAKLQAAQVKQQLATQTLSIANGQPQWLLSLFRPD